MSREDCGEWREELSECARGGAGASPRLGAHLSECAACMGRWDAERRLSAELRELREARAGERSDDVWRRRLMAEFARFERIPARPWLRWAWAPASAALVLMASLQVWLGAPGPVVRQAFVQYEEVAGSPSGDVDEDSGFIPVPYALPLATGESVRHRPKGTEWRGPGPLGYRSAGRGCRRFVG